MNGLLRTEVLDLLIRAARYDEPRYIVEDGGRIYRVGASAQDALLHWFRENGAAPWPA
jgi:hypothetical protein